ncbi:MAG: plastocyanin [Natronomonas sp.]|jgi:plastocyanin|uniref:cupredoxin domain-containing protein n=1 Tax=Natronomonas sp. TaxID=2184060 RepID=UPI003989F122
MDRRAFIATAGATLSASLGGCLASGLREDEYDIGMSANAFQPDTLEVAVGDTVVWGNNGSRGHTVTAYDASLPEGAAFFASGGFEETAAAREGWEDDGDGTLSPGTTFEHTFETVGTHDYFCIPHESAGMVGVIEVVE